MRGCRCSTALPFLLVFLAFHTILVANSTNITLYPLNYVNFTIDVSIGVALLSYQNTVLLYPNVTLGFIESFSNTLITSVYLFMYNTTPLVLNSSPTIIYGFMTNYTFMMMCSIPRNNRVNVTVVLNGWGLVYNYTVAGSNWFILYTLSGNVPSVTVYPSGSWDVNVSSLVVTVYNVPVEPGQARLCAPLVYTTVSGERVNTTICCTITWAILVAVVSHITTYTPNVTVRGYVQDAYTYRLLPGVPIRIYVDGEYYTTVTTGPDGYFTVTFYFEEPGRHVVQYYWYDVLEATQYIDYIGVPGVEQAYRTATQAINLIHRIIPAAPPVLTIPRPSLTNTLTILVAGMVAALWAWMAREVDVSYATLIAGFILVAIGLLTRNYYLITPGAVALALAPILRRLSG